MIEALGRSCSQRISRIVDTPVSLSYGEILEYIAGYEFGWQKWRWECEYCALIHLEDEKCQLGLTKKYETGNLDPDTSKKIMRLIKSISSEEQTIVMATHDYDIIEQFPGRIIQFQNKSIEE